MDRRVILVGGFHEIIELCEDNDVQIMGVIDNNIITNDYYGYPLLGKDSDAAFLYDKYKDIKLLITPDIPSVRLKLYNFYKQIGFNIATLISKEAYVSRYSLVNEGAIIQRGVNISSNVRIGKMVKLNINVNLMHDCIVDDFVTIAPNAVVLGKVNIGSDSYIGANSTILPTLNIGKRSIVGAGAVVTRTIGDNQVVKGVPAK